MSDVYPVVSQLSKIAKSKPVNATGEALSIWDELVELIKGVVQKIIDDAKGTITKTVDNVKTAISGKVSEVYSYLSTLIGGVYTSLTTTIKTNIDNVITVVSGVADAVKDKIEDTIGDIVQALKDAIGAVKDKIAEIVDEIKSAYKSITKGLSDAISSIGKWISDNVKSAITAIGGYIGNVIDNVWDAVTSVQKYIGDRIKLIKDGIVEGVKEVIAWVKDRIGDVVNQISITYESVKTTVEKKIQDVIDWLKQTWEDFKKWFNEQLLRFADWFGKEVTPIVDGSKALYKDVTGKVNNIYDKLTGGKYTSFEDLFEDVGGIIGLRDVGEGLYGVWVNIARLQALFEAQFAGIGISAEKHALINLAMEAVSINDMASAVFRGKATNEQFKRNAYLSGVTQDKAQAVLEASRALPTPGAIQEAFLRGEIGEKEHDNLLFSYGYTKENVELFKALYWVLPTPNDLIRMAVREVFSPEIAQRFGQFEDFPRIFVEWSKKIGLSEEWAKNYWAAHWDLPSPQMGFEMLHRGVIDANELQLLLRALDVMPYWRERLIKISYSPLTRVDVRRMYQFGVLDEKQVKRAYLDLGYNEEKAGWLTEFTKRYSAPEDTSELTEFRTLARTTYSQAYKKNIINREEYIKFMTEMKYHPDDVNLLVSLDDYAKIQTDKLFDTNDYRKEYQKLALEAYDRGLLDNTEITDTLSTLGYDNDEIVMEISLLDYNRQLRLRNLIVTQLHDQYINFIIDNTQLTELLNMFEFTSLEASRLEEEWNIERSLRSKQPPLSDLKAFLRDKVIDLDMFLNELRGLGYNEKYIDYYRQSYQAM